MFNEIREAVHLDLTEYKVYLNTIQITKNYHTQYQMPMHTILILARISRVDSTDRKPSQFRCRTIFQQ